MSLPLNHFDAWWFRPAPALRPAIMRVLLGTYGVSLLAIRGGHYAAVGALPAQRFAPVGVIGLLDTPTPPAFAALGVLLAAGLGVAFTLGFRFRFSGPGFALALLWVTSYRNSWGHVSHHDNLVVLHALVLGLSPAADAWSLDARRQRHARPWSYRYGWPLRLMAVLGAITYVLAGWAKLRLGGAAWLGGQAVQLQVAFDALRKARFGVAPSPLAAWLVPHAWAFAPAGVVTLALELGAPLALLGGRIATVWAAGMWLLHIAIAIVMALAFAYPLSFIAFVPLFRAERVAAHIRRRLHRARVCE